MIEKTLDVTELPVAKTVKDGDQLLLVRTQKNGVKVPMRMEPQKLTKQKKQQIVIGRAIRPRACQIGGVENWYVFGGILPGGNLPLLLNIASMLSYSFTNPNLGYDMVVLNITDQKTGKVYVFKQEVDESDHKDFFKRIFVDDSTALTVDWFLAFYPRQRLANAFRVDSYDLTERVLTLNLTHKCLQTTDLRGTSTHHYFKDGVRRWHVSKDAIAARAFNVSHWVGRVVCNCDVDGIVISDYVLLKKEVAQLPHLPQSKAPGRGYGYVVSYSTVTNSDDKILCQVNHKKSKRRPYGKYMIWSQHRWFPYRKSDEYLHCRMKCVGLGKRKNVSSGPSFDSYRVTVREI